MASLSHDEKVAKLKSAVDFVQRYDEGPPEEGISGDEALGNFEAVSSKISNDDFQAALTDSYARLSPDQRSQLSEMVRQRAPGQLDNVNFNDPQEFAQAATSFGNGGPAGLTELLGISGATNAVDGGGGGGMLSGLLGGLLGGGDDSDNRARQGSQSEGLESLISNPIVRALLGGIAAYAMKRILGGAAGGGSRSGTAGATGGGIEDMLGGLLGGGGSRGGGGNLDDILGGLIGGGKGGSLDDILGGLVGGGGQGGHGGSSPDSPRRPRKDRSREL